MWSNRWKKGVDYPEWADAEVYKKTITGGYLYNGETPREAYMRVAKTVAMRLKKPEICLLYTSPSPRDLSTSRMPSSA